MFKTSLRKKIAFFLELEISIGNLKFEQIDTKKKTSVLGILIGEKKFRNRGLSLTAIKKGMDYLSNNYNIRYFWLGVNKKNLPAINLYKKAGFRIKKQTSHSYKMMRDIKLLNLSKLSLGTAQLGMDYRINNRQGKIKINEAKKIVKYCRGRN